MSWPQRCFASEVLSDLAPVNFIPVGAIEEIRVEIDSSTSDHDREKLQERLAKLSGGVASIAAMVLTTEALITDFAQEEAAPAMAPGGGMY